MRRIITNFFKKIINPKSQNLFNLKFKLFNKKELDNNSLKQKQRFLKATGFGLWEKYQDLTYNNSDDQRFDIIFTIDYPHKGSPKKVVPRLLVLDIKKSGN